MRVQGNSPAEVCAGSVAATRVCAPGFLKTQERTEALAKFTLLLSMCIGNISCGFFSTAKWEQQGTKLLKPHFQGAVAELSTRLFPAVQKHSVQVAAGLGFQVGQCKPNLPSDVLSTTLLLIKLSSQTGE